MGIYKDNDPDSSKPKEVICKVHQRAIAEFIANISKKGAENIIVHEDEGQLFEVRYKINH